MNCEDYGQDIKLKFNAAPGGCEIADALISRITPMDSYRLLDLEPGYGAMASVIAKEYGCRVTCIAGTPEIEAEAEDTAASLDVSSNITVIPGSPSMLPTPSEEFNIVYCLGHPFIPIATPELARELYRVIMPDGILAFAGPMSLANTTPDYMETALDDFSGIKLRTPAYMALLFSREGFHIVTAEYFTESWDHWNEWLNDAPVEMVPEAMRRGVIEDAGKWLALGLIILRKPPKPAWAL